MVTAVPRKDVDPELLAMDLFEGGVSIGAFEAAEISPHTAEVSCFKLDSDVSYKQYGDLLFRAGLNMLEHRGYTRVLLPEGLLLVTLVDYLGLDERDASGCHVIRLPEFFERPCIGERAGAGR